MDNVILHANNDNFTAGISLNVSKSLRDKQRY
jgi:hypothetical protein